MKKLMIAMAILVFAAGYAADAGAQATVVVPNSLRDTEGDTANLFPLGCGDVSPSQRYQQVYAAEQLAFGGTITALKFRLDENEPSGFAPVTIPNLQIDMSITPSGPGNLSGTYADNLGPVVQTVFLGDLMISAPPCNSDPCPFDIMVPLQTPFDYDSSQGNLIVDWRVNECITIVNFTNDATEDEIGTMQRVFNQNVDSPTGTAGNSNLGIVTQFVIEGGARIAPIPTLSQWGMIAAVVGLGFIGFVAIRRRAASKV